ncbi:acylphosphatase [Aquimarina sp. D1M17]|uniref:acylphosphatase n=1 Tax=Aquimarina acroporae TaxID=2937283 RepID=UPI0020C17C26|nr:acylphosphatase [Aquimarina acroporae]MCK8520923.1 acylphosphatase [Aquimarina acroporae]
MKKHYNITVSGTVQGVWYRKNTLEKAIELGVTGYVKNLINGNVYIEAEGTKEQLQALLDWCAIGPEYAKVDQVSFEEGALMSFARFEIER